MCGSGYTDVHAEGEERPNFLQLREGKGWESALTSTPLACKVYISGTRRGGKREGVRGFDDSVLLAAAPVT